MRNCCQVRPRRFLGRNRPLATCARLGSGVGTFQRDVRPFGAAATRATRFGQQSCVGSLMFLGTDAPGGMQDMKKLIQTAVATLFAASSAQAQSPQLVPVQGFVSAEAPRWNVASMRFVGSRLAFGLPEDNTYGAVRFLEPAASGWRLSTTGIQSPDAECRDFGLSLAVDGTRVAVGSSSGHVFVFETATETPSLIAAWRAAPAGYALVHHLSGDALLVGLPASNGGQGGGALLRIQGAAMSVTQALVPSKASAAVPDSRIREIVISKSSLLCAAERAMQPERQQGFSPLRQ